MLFILCQVSQEYMPTSLHHKHYWGALEMLVDQHATTTHSFQGQSACPTYCLITQSYIPAYAIRFNVNIFGPEELHRETTSVNIKPKVQQDQTSKWIELMDAFSEEILGGSDLPWLIKQEFLTFCTPRGKSTLQLTPVTTGNIYVRMYAGIRATVYLSVNCYLS